MQHRTFLLLANLALALGLGAGVSAGPLPDPGCSLRCAEEFDECMAAGGSLRECRAARLACVRSCGLNG